MVSWAKILNSELEPYFNAASLGDWCEPLTKLVNATDVDKLKRIKQATENALRDLGFVLPKSFNELGVIYLNRVRLWVNRELVKQVKF